ncbi:MAG: MMPL family transporter [Planctomycetes bacterium]|nr:MMPL family transporter [Planctomycetota bacterium]
MLRRSSRLALGLGYAVLLGLTAVLFHAQQQQAVDASNRALKVPDGDDARNLAALAEVVPDDAVVLVGFAAAGDLPLPAADRTALAGLPDRVALLPGVAACREVPSPDPGLWLHAVSLRAADPAASAEQVVAAARAVAPPTVRVLATGLARIEGRIAERVAAERRHIVPWLVAALLLAALVVYRHPALAAAALLPALFGITWTGGLIAWRGEALDPVAALLDPVLLTIGVAASVHFVEAWRRGRAAGLDATAAARFAGEDQRQPAFLAAATTMLGLASLCVSPVPAVAAFGLHAAFGVALVHLFTFALLPAWLAAMARGAATPAAAASRAFTRWPQRIGRHRGAWLMAATALTSLALAGLPALHADNDPLTMLPASDPVRAEHDELAARLGGVEVFHLLVPAGSPGGEPARLLPFLAAMQAQPGVAGLAGPVLRGDEGDLAAPLLLRPAGSAVRAPLFAAVDLAARVLGLDGARAAGPAVQIARDSALLVARLVGSSWLTLGLLAAALCIGLRSARLGLFGLGLNVLPCVWIYGAIAWLDRPVSVATAMIACTMLGLIVDNTLHLLHHYRLERRHLEAPAAVAAALGNCGRGVLLSSALLLVGFLVTTQSRLSTTVEFSLLAMATIAAALAGNLVLLPLALGRGRRRTDAL